MRLKQACSISGDYGINVSAEEYTDAGLPMIRTSDVDDFGYVSLDGVKLVEPGRAAGKLLRRGDIIFSRAGTIGRCMKYDGNDRATFAAYLVRFRCKPGVLDPEFVRYWAQSDHYWHQIGANKIESTIGNFSANKFSSLELPSIEFKHQKRIAAYLDRETARIDALIAKKEKLTELLAKKRASLISIAVTGGASSKRWRNKVDDTELFRSAIIGSLFDVVGGATPKSGDSQYWGGDIAWVGPADLGKLTTKNIYKGLRSITEIGHESCGTRIVPKGTIILSTRAPIGHVAIAQQELCFNQGCRGLVPRSSILSEFAYWALLALRDRLTAAGQGTTFLELSRDSLRAQRIPLPDISTQEAIANYLDRETMRIDTSVAKVKTSIGKLREYRAAMITAAVTGQIDVPTTREEEAA